MMIFANGRGFSGGSRDMAGEILKFGAMIVDALREYSNPVYIYLLFHGELRGGSWVVVNPTINEDKMKMYAGPDSRGGILEPAGITESSFARRLQCLEQTQDNLLGSEEALRGFLILAIFVARVHCSGNLCHFRGQPISTLKQK